MSDNTKKKITILIPAYNEEASLPRLYAKLTEVMADPRGEKYDWELLFVNDGSRDRTLPMIQELRRRDPRVSYINLSRNFGKEKAMLAGFDYATGDCMVILDADLQDPPELIYEMAEKWEAGYDDVYARRRDRGRESWLRRRLSLLFYRILQKTSRIDVLQNVGDFRLLDRKCITQLQQLRESERYTKGMFCWIGFNKTCVEFDRGDRVAGSSSWSMWKLMGLAIEGIVSFTTAPLRFATIVGAVISLLAFALGLFYGLKALIWGDDVTGFPTLAVAIFFLGGIQLLCLGIIGEYIGRVFVEAKHRPVYIAASYNGETPTPKTK